MIIRPKSIRNGPLEMVHLLCIMPFDSTRNTYHRNRATDVATDEPHTPTEVVDPPSAHDWATDAPIKRAMRKKMIDHGVPVSPLQAMPSVHLCPEVDLTKVDPSTVNLYPLFSSPTLCPVLNVSPNFPSD